MKDIKSLVRNNIKKLKPYTSARDSYQSGILLDANENSMGSVIENNSNLNRYPDPSQKLLRAELGKLISISPGKLFFGVGSDEIIDLLVRIFCTPGVDNVVIPEPTYGMYKVACDINDVATREIALDEDFQIDVKSTFEVIDENSKMIFLCSPNNPTGNVLRIQDVEELCGRFNGIVVVDEAYIDFDEDYSMLRLTDTYNNVVITRTFSKAWGLAGARCGYCIANEEVTEYLFKIKAPYNLNKLTSDIILKAIMNYSRRKQFVDELNKERKRISHELNKMDSIEKVFSSNANFVLFKCSNARMVYQKLASKGVIIRDRSNQLNLQDCLRVSVGTESENNLFLKSLREII